MFGLDTAALGLKMGAFFGKAWLRIVIITIALAALTFAMWQTIRTVRNWQEVSYKTGFVAGQNEANTAWQSVAADNFKKQRDQAIADANRNNQTVSDYLADAQIARMKQSQTKEGIKQYAQTPAGSRRCVDRDGVRLILQGRRNLGFASAPGETH